MLASNYLEITEHPLFSDVEQLMGTAKVTPAEVGEQLLKNEEPDIALRGLIEFLERKKRESDETEASKEEVVARGVEGTQEVEDKGGDEIREDQKSQEI
jgi:chaperone BCS1